MVHKSKATPIVSCLSTKSRNLGRIDRGVPKERKPEIEETKREEEDNEVGKEGDI